MAHGGGGVKMHQLLDEHIIGKLGSLDISQLTDSAVISIKNQKVCITTDSFVVQPLFFSGGDIGRLSVCGTVNDLAVMGAKPIAMTLSLIIEEGFEISCLDRIMESIASTADEAGVKILTGDTKVVERTKGDGIYINTAGIGILDNSIELGLKKIQKGDKVIVSGIIGEHGLAVMSARDGLKFNTVIKSDVAPVNNLTAELLANLDGVRFMRDPTRAGVAGVLSDICDGSGLTVVVNEADIPVSAAVKSGCELLGLDVLNVANEGKIVIVVSQEQAQKALEICAANKYGKNAAIIGQIMDSEPAIVEMITKTGGGRIIQRPYGQELPRIC